MKVYVDTNFLVAFTVPMHPHHGLATANLETLRPGARLVFSLHGLAEYYATVTKPPLPFAQQPALARRQVDLLHASPQLEIGVVTPDTYLRATEIAGRLGLASGAVYDALHLACAEAAGCARLLTLNGRDFLRMQPLTEVAIGVVG